MTLAKALTHLRAGDWRSAHPLVQEDESALGCWAHGIVHLLERDYDNARYWYRRAHRHYPGDDGAPSEIDALARAFQAAGGAGQ